MSKWVNKRTNACERAYLLAHLFTSFACSPMFTNFVLRTKRINEHTQHTHSVDFCIGTHSTHNTHLSHSDYTIYTYILYIWKKLFLRICLVIVVQILWCCCYARSFFFGYAHQNAWLCYIPNNNNNNNNNGRKRQQKKKNLSVECMRFMDA